MPVVSDKASTGSGTHSWLILVHQKVSGLMAGLSWPSGQVTYNYLCHNVTLKSNSEATLEPMF